MAKGDHAKPGPGKAAPTQVTVRACSPARAVPQGMHCTAPSNCTMASATAPPASRQGPVLAMPRVPTTVPVCGYVAFTNDFPGEMLLPNCVTDRGKGNQSGGEEQASWHMGKGRLRRKRWLRHEQRKSMVRSKAGKKEKTGKEAHAHSARICSRGLFIHISR